MKNIILPAAFLFMAQIAFCQQNIKPFAGIQQNLSIQKTTFRLSTLPTAGLRFNRHTIQAGPVILLHNFPSAEENLPRLTGLQTTYGYRLTKKEEALFHISVEISSKLQSFKEEWTSNYWNARLQQYQDVQSGSRELLMENYIGIGAALQLTKMLELKSTFSAGYFHSSIKPWNSFAAESAIDGHDYRFYQNGGVAFSAGIGLIWYFKEL